MPTVAPEERYAVSRCYTYGAGPNKQAIPNCYRLIVRHGYTDEIITPDLGTLVLDLVRSFLTSQKNSGAPESDTGRLDALHRAWKSQVIYIVGKEQLKIPAKTNIARRFFLWAFLWMRDASRTKVQHLNVETDRVVEVGFVKEM
jgi:KUP system potassium uptake protein